MKKLFFLTLSLAIVALFSSCNNYEATTGELTGVGTGKDWYEPDPYGMVFIPQGAFNMGPNDQDIAFSYSSQSKTVSIDPFWMDVTEITNSEYKQFVWWVRDSIGKRLLVKADVAEYKDQRDWSGVDPAFYDHENTETCYLNADKAVEWNSEDETVREALRPLFLKKEEQFYGQKEIDARKLVYEYYWVDLKQAAKRVNRYNFNDDYTDGKYKGNVVNEKGNVVAIKDRSSFIMKGRVNVYPDTLVWMQDYTYSFNEPLARTYFWHKAYNDYPVVGVDWLQANAFCIWRTQIMRVYQYSIGEQPFQDYRLPTEAEWEYAARGGLSLSMYPWGGPYTRNVSGCFIANFKPLRGRYGEDGGNRTLEVMKYAPNEYGLYDMAGNLSEWTANAYDESSYSFTHDLNPIYTYNALREDPPALKRKVVRGGSWKDVAYYLQVGVRAFEFQDTAKSYIGFRCVRSYMGRDATDWDASRF